MYSFLPSFSFFSARPAGIRGEELGTLSLIPHPSLRALAASARNLKLLDPRKL